MLRWVRQKLGVALILRDTAKTLDAVRKMPRTAQVDIAHGISSVMVEAEEQMRSLPRRPSLEVRQLAARYVAQARQDRQAALRQGAVNRRDPDWAKAALVESWALGLSGELGESAFADINVGLRVFVTGTLRPEPKA